MFKLDLADFVDDLGSIFNEKEIDRLGHEAAKRIGWAAHDELKALASEKLDKTAKKYVQAISDPKVEGSRVEITLTGWLPVALESGVGPFNMRPGLLRSPKAKIGKAGQRYIRVPIGDDRPATIRTISSAVPRRNFRHPGLKARKFFDETLARIDEKASKILDGLLMAL